MPLIILCPECETKIKVPETAAGKTGKCPKCTAAFIVPNTEPAPAPAVVTPVSHLTPAVDGVVSPRKKPSAVVLDDEDDDYPRKKKRAADYDDDDEVDDRPVTKKKNKRKPVTKKGAPLAPIAIVLGILAVIGAGVGGYFLFKGGKNSVFGGGASWTKFDAPDGSFSTSFPGGTPTTFNLMDALQQGKNVQANNPQAQQAMDQAKAMMESMGMKIEAWSRLEKGQNFVAGFISFPPAFAAMMNPNDIFKNNAGRAGGFGGGGMGSGTSVISEEDVTHSGQKWKRALIKKSETEKVIMQIAIIKNRMFMLMVEGDANLKIDDKIAKEFFEKFELKTIPDPPPGSNANPLTDMMKGMQGLPNNAKQPPIPRNPRKQ